MIISYLFFHRFVDRDMVMRYHWGLGVGHIYSHDTTTHPLATVPLTSSPKPTTASGSQDDPHQTDLDIMVTTDTSVEMDIGATQSKANDLHEGDEDGEESDRSVEDLRGDVSDSDSDNQEAGEDANSDQSEDSDPEMEVMYGDFDPDESTSYD